MDQHYSNPPFAEPTTPNAGSEFVAYQPVPPPPPPAPGFGVHPVGPGLARPKGPMLGVASLAVVVAAAGFSFLGAWWLTAAIRQGMAVIGPQYSGTVNLGPAVTQPVGTIVAAGFIGFLAWVIAIVAASTRRGRPAAIIAIVVGVLAPLATAGYLWAAIGQIFTSHAP